MKNSNPWLLVAGILSIIFSVLYFVSLIVCIVAVSNAESILADMTNYQDVESFKIAMTVLLVYCICSIGLSIFNSVVYMKYYQVPYEDLKLNMGLPMVAIVFSFISGNLLSGIFGIVAICVKPEQASVNAQADSNTNEVGNKTEKSEFEKFDNELTKLKSLKEKGLIDEEQYNSLRMNIINKYLKR